MKITTHQFIKMMFGDMPREIGTPYRRITMSLDSMLQCIMRLNGKSNLYTSLYAFKKINGDGRPNYDTAVINKILFDFDGVEQGQEEMLNFHIAMERENIMHTIDWSGGGAHGYVFCTPYIAEHPSGCIAHMQDYIAEIAGISYDPAVRGRPSQIVRFPGTLNIKRRIFCIPLIHEQIHDFNMSMALNPKGQMAEIIEGELLTPKDYDTPLPGDSLSLSIGDQIYEAPIDDIEIDRACIQKFLDEKEVGNQRRFWWYLHLKDKKFTFDESIAISRKYFGENEFEHSIEEGQARKIFESGYIFPPPPHCIEKMKHVDDGKGACNQQECEVYKNWVMKEVEKYV